MSSRQLFALDKYILFDIVLMIVLDNDNPRAISGRRDTAKSCENHEPLKLKTFREV